MQQKSLLTLGALLFPAVQERRIIIISSRLYAAARQTDNLARSSDITALCCDYYKLLNNYEAMWSPAAEEEFKQQKKFLFYAKSLCNANNHRDLFETTLLRVVVVGVFSVSPRRRSIKGMR